MKSVKKLLCLIGAGMIVIGAVLAGVCYNILGSKEKLNPDKMVNETYDYTEDIREIDIKAMDISILPSADDQVHLDITDYKKAKNTVTVENGVLKMRRSDKRPWYRKMFNFNLGWKQPNVKLYLPDKEYDALTICAGSGDVELDSAISVNKLTLKCTSGDIVFKGTAKEVSLTATSGDIKYLGSADTVEVKVSSGDIKYNGSAKNVTLTASSGDINVSGDATESIYVKTSSGDIEVSDIVCSGMMEMHSTSGDIDFSKCDAGELKITASSGDVDGSLLSEKIIYTDTSSGDVKVPKGTSGGVCDITTSSGDIKIVFR